MTRLVLLLFVVWLSLASASFRFFRSIIKGVNKEMQTLAEPIEKTVVSIGFSQCKNVKRLLGVDYDSYGNMEPALSAMTLNFITRAVTMSYNLTAAAALIPRSMWFNPRQPLKIYLHGFTDAPNKSGYTHLNQAFLSQGDFNVLALDASSMLRWKYLKATTMVRFIGEELGKILVALVLAGLPPSYIHLIGHSLGSHIAGFAGQTFLSLTGHRVGRISGLDPAGPCFSHENVTLRLSIGDADFVDVIHTDGGVYGLEEQVGHVDFYPNGGTQQPGCRPALLLASCSHSRAWELFAESVSYPGNFVAVNCGSMQDFRNGMCDDNVKSFMGYGCQLGTLGLYYLRTADDSPYGLGEEGAKYAHNRGLLKNLGIKLGLLSRKSDWTSIDQEDLVGQINRF